MTTNDDNKTEDLARRPSPVTPEVRVRVGELHALGLGRNAIARELRIATGSVSKIAREWVPEPLTFDRTETAIALQARMLDLKTIREQLARKFLVAADDSLELLAAPVILGQFGGKDNTWNETLLDEPTIDQRKVLIGSAVAAASKGIDLMKLDAEQGSVSARGMVVELAAALTEGLKAMEAAGIEAVDPTTTPEQPVGT